MKREMYVVNRDEFYNFDVYNIFILGLFVLKFNSKFTSCPKKQSSQIQNF